MGVFKAENKQHYYLKKFTEEMGSKKNKNNAIHILHSCLYCRYVMSVVPWWLFWYIVRSFTKGGRQIYPICVEFVMLKLFFQTSSNPDTTRWGWQIAPYCAASSYGLAVGLLFPLYISFYTTSRVYWTCILERHKTKFSDLHTSS